MGNDMRSSRKPDATHGSGLRREKGLNGLATGCSDGSAPGTFQGLRLIDTLPNLPTGADGLRY
jgi:hypothetical protein